MNTNREELLFQLALTKSGAEREDFLARECRNDDVMRARLDALLAAHGQPEGPLAESVPATKATMKIEFADVPDEAIGQKIGRYKILEKIGEGGCGVVYVAEQTEPVRRRVALKVIKLGMDTKAVVARFEAERQALAMMDHPNIAKVLDAGTTDTGRPYFIMELVRGIRITDYCDQNKQSTSERLDLFVKICQAIQHAHQKGIIHRDIKPSNILVTLHDGVPVPKVIDFGIAKATEGRLTDATVYTQLHQFIGTPAYMSPEQAEMSGLDIDTRSDIYSVGVLLYELLTGRTPFDANELMSQGIDAMRKTIREEDPVRPSTKFATLQGEDLTTTAKRRSSDRSKLLHQLKGDLDWIVMKCLEKDRTRRYETANGLAMDLKRHLNNETVTARPPSKLYEFQKTYRRHKVGFTATVAIIVVLVGGVLVSSWEAARAIKAKSDAEASRSEAVKAQAGEARLRERAEVDELAARQRAYASDMNVAMQALNADNLGRTVDLLNRQRPQPGQKDLRGWEWRYLWGQSRSDAIFTLGQEPSEINSLAVSPDGVSLAVGSYHRGGVALWDLRTRRMLVRLSENAGDAKAAFSPTEPLLAFAATDSSGPAAGRPTLHLWNTATRQAVTDVPLEDARCEALAFSKDGRTLLTATALARQGGHMALWRPDDGTKIAGFPTDSSSSLPATAFAVTPDFSLAAYTFGPPSPGHIRVLDMHSGHEIWSAAAADVFVTALAFSPDGKTLASGAGFTEKDIRLWDVATGKEIGRLEGHQIWISSLVFSRDGTQLISSSADQTIRVWDIASRRCLNVLHGHRQEVWRLACLPDGKTLVSGGKDGTVCFWDTSIPTVAESRATISDNVTTWRFAPDSQSLFTLNLRGEVKRWSGFGYSQSELLFQIGAVRAAPVSFYKFSGEARLLAASAESNTFNVWDVARRGLQQRWTNSPAGMTPMAFHGNSNRLISTMEWGGNDANFEEWDSNSGAGIQTWTLPGRFQEALAVSPDGLSCVAFNYDGDGIVRNLADRRSANLDLRVVEAASASYSPDGKLLAIGSDLGFAQIVDAATFHPVATLGGYLPAAHTVTFSADGKRLAIGSGSRYAVTLFDTESWQNLVTLEGEGADFHGVSFSPDGNAIGWLSQGGVLTIWRAPSWTEINAAEETGKSGTARQ